MPDASEEDSRITQLSTFNFQLTSDIYSHLSATIGSTFAARRAGIQQAASATPASNNAINANVVGSVAGVSNSMVDISRVSAQAAATPITTPTDTSAIPCPMTNRSTLRGCAPRAILTPISRVRWVTAQDITP